MPDQDRVDSIIRGFVRSEAEAERDLAEAMRRAAADPNYLPGRSYRCYLGKHANCNGENCGCTCHAHTAGES